MPAFVSSGCTRGNDVTTLAEQSVIVARRSCGSRASGVIASLEELLLRQVECALERNGLADGSTRALLYGAGRHTWWLLRASRAIRSLALAAIVDDRPPHCGAIDGLPALTPEAALERFGRRVSVVLSTDTWQAPMRDRARSIFGPNTPVADLYDGLPAGPFWRGPALVTRETQRPLREPSETCIARTTRLVAPYLERRAARRVCFVGDHWRTFAAASALMAEGFEPVLDPRRADVGVVCDSAIERGPLTNVCPGLRGPLLTLWNGPRPWLGEAPSAGPGIDAPRGVALRLECSDAHARQALEALPEWIGRFAGRSVPVFAERRGEPVGDAVVYTLTDPPNGTDPLDWLAVQCELPPRWTGDRAR